MTGPTYLILDFETTGLSPKDSELIEIAALKMNGLSIVDRYETLVRPKSKVPQLISDLTGISNEMLNDAPSLEDVAEKFGEFIADLPLVAHNSEMEQGFLDEHINPLLDRQFKVENSIEPLALLFPEQPSQSLDSFRKLFAINTDRGHRAMADCEDLAAILEKAHQALTNHRQATSRIAFDLLPDWWWNWFFNEVDTPASLRETIEKDAIGDLRELREKDSERDEPTTPWKQAVTKEQVHTILTSAHADELGFTYREEQERMAQEVRQAITEGERIAVEAPTGTGKSLAYLIPGLLTAQKTGVPLVVSTHSKSLQDQLLNKDIPFAKELLQNNEVKATAVKGQDNYLCIRKLWDIASTLDEEASFDERFSAAYLLSLAANHRAAELGNISRYLTNQFEGMGRLIEQTRSQFNTTMGAACPFYRSCHFFDSARLAHQSHLIIANHSLVFHWPAHLPAIRTIVFDEAHHLENQITEAYSHELKETALADALDKLSRKHGSRRTGDCTVLKNILNPLTLPEPYDSQDAGKLLTEFTDSIRNRITQVSAVVPPNLNQSRDRFDGYEEPIDLDKQGRPSLASLRDALEQLKLSISSLADYLRAGSKACDGAPSRHDPALDILALHLKRFEEFELALVSALEEEPNTIKLIYWYPKENIWRVSVQPVEVKKLVENFMASKRAVILTSATLTTGRVTDFVTARIGLGENRPIVTLPSPYKLHEQARVYIPSDVGAPGTQGHLAALIEFTEQVATALGGRTLLLMTSNRRLTLAAEELRKRLTSKGISVFDSVSERRAAEAFRTSQRAVLIGGERYGEGLDIPGKALTCVIIEKINEAMTRSPLAEARKARTAFPLYDYDFPLRMMWLKQRAGRLIRSPSDTGAIVIMDPRYHAWSHGSRDFVNKALAPMPIKLGSREKVVMEIENSLS